MTRMLRLKDEAAWDALQRSRSARFRRSAEFVNTDIPTLTQTVKPAKYRNVKTGKYSSKREATRAAELKLQEIAGEITDLQEQVRFLLIPKQDGERAVFYVADFVYKRCPQMLRVVEDVKSLPTKTPAYVIKRKLMLFVHKIRVVEI